MIKNKNRVYLLLIVVLIVLSGIVFFNKSNKTLSKASNFSVKKKQGVTKVVLSLNTTTTVLEKSNKQWIVNNKFLVRSKAISSFLKVLSRIDVLAPVSYARQVDAKNKLDTNSVFVEIYKNHRKLKSYYLSLPSSENSKTYITKEKDSEIFVARIPSHSGNIAVLFVLDENYWRNKIVFDYKPQQIKSVLVKIPSEPKSSFKITNFNDGSFSIKAIDKTIKIDNFNVKKAARYFTYFRNISFIDIAKISSRKEDSILNSDALYSISLEDINGYMQKIDIYRKPQTHNQKTQNSAYNFDPNIAYGCINDSKEIIEIKYYKIDLLMKELKYFLTP
ncbi:MAG: DUF4340 domain-containing protein [Bacteroidales bacterium]|jgi:hypothetical protein|nr:DUF4340 domain-containing protein [Bacteroidales bacterium]